MSYKISFQERARISAEQIAKQKPVTLEQARAQAQRLCEKSSSQEKKKRI